MRRLRDYGAPAWLAIVIVTLGATLAISGMIAIVSGSLEQFQEQLPALRERVDLLIEGAIGVLHGYGVNISTEEMASRFDAGAIMQLAGDTVQSLLAAISNAFLVVLMVVFMLIEADQLPDKIRAYRSDPDDDLSDLSAATETIQKYLAIKSWVSAGTGITITLYLWLIGVDFPVLWGLLAFLFNFIPNIGSILASIPAVLLAFVQHGTGIALATIAGYLVVNMVFGNALEPRLMGRRLGLSTLVVFLSLVFWGWLWGPVGMLLSVPLTVIVKIFLEHSEDMRGIAIFLGPGGELEQKK